MIIMDNTNEFANEFGFHVQVAVALLFVFESLTVAFFKAILVFFLRFHGLQTENRAIMSYHLFQTLAYFSAFFTGLTAMQSVQVALVLLIILYLLGSACLAYALMGMPAGDMTMPYVIALFGLGHGSLKSVIHRMLKLDLIGNAFGYMSFVLLLFELILIGTIPMGDLSVQPFVIIGLLAVVICLLLVAVMGSLFDRHKSDDYTFTEVFGATFYGLVGMLLTAEESLTQQGMAVRRRLKGQKGPIPLLKQLNIQRYVHWMDHCIGRYPNEFVQDLKEKFRLHKFYLCVAGLWIGVEMKYSYWIFSTFLTKRVLGGTTVWQPPQFIAMTPLIFLIFGPVFYLLIRPALSKSFYHTSFRQMCLGAFFVVCAATMGWRLSAMQTDLSTEFIEADSNHQKVRILNGFDCKSGFSYYFPMDPNFVDTFRPRPALDVDHGEARAKNKTIKKMYRPQQIDMITNILLPSIDESFLRYANIRFLDKARIGDMVWDKVMPTDSFTYLMDINSIGDHAVTISAFGYCEPLDEFALKIPLMNNRSNVDRLLVYLIQNKGSVVALPFHDINYARDPWQRPGFRVYIAADDKPQRVDVFQGEKNILTVPQGKDVQQPSDIVWIKEGEGNLEVKVMQKSLYFNYTLGTAELVDILVIVQNDGKAMAKMLHVASPITISGKEPLLQYMIIPFGEFLLGIVGLQQMLARAPQKLKYHVFVDWYLMLGFANLTILLISQSTWLVIMHQQMSILVFIVGMSFLAIILMAGRY